MTNREKFTEIFGCEIAQRDTGEAIPGHCKILIASDRHFNDWLQQEYVPSAQLNLSEAYSKAVFTWLRDYQIRAAELKGRYTPYEVLSWVINDWRKENG